MKITSVENFKKITMGQLGQGCVLPVAYDTAWLARIPDFPDISRPAFPKSLEWLRTHQQSDGSWGTLRPLNAHSNTLSTLAAILSLSQWQNPTDKIYIDRGIKALEALAELLANEPIETVGFEILLPALLQEYESLGLILSKKTAQHYQRFLLMGEEKKKLIREAQKKTNETQAASWWFSLEMLGGSAMLDKKIDLDIHESMLFENGSIAASPAATAFFLSAMRYRDKDVPKAFYYLQSLVAQNSGGVPDVFPIDEFELSFSAKYLLEAGIPPNDPYIRNILELVHQKWQHRQAIGFGYSSDFAIDPDDTALGMCVLTHLDAIKLDPKVLLQFFNGTCIENFRSERLPSISANIHVLTALRQFEPTAEITKVINAILEWLAVQIKTNGILSDKWHSSSIYPMSRAVIALQGLDDSLAQHCVAWLVSQQQTNGGWGVHGYATMEETSFASLALAYWYRQKSQLNKTVLQKAQKYLHTAIIFPDDPLWIGKVLYCPKLVVASLLAAARYALADVLATKKNKLQVPKNSNNLAIKKSLLAIAPPFKARKITTVAKNIKKWAINRQLYEAKHPIFKSDYVKCSANAFGAGAGQNLEIYTAFGLLLLTLDDLLDENWQMFTPKKLREFFNIMVASLQGVNIKKLKKTHSDIRFSNVAFALLDIRNKLLRKNLNIQHFQTSIKYLLAGFMQEFNCRKNEKLLSLEKYLNIRIIVGGMDSANELVWALKKIKLSANLRNDTAFKKLKKHAYQALIIINDLFSFNKELKQGDINNYLLILQANNQYSLQEAIDECILRYNKAIKKFIDGRESLLANMPKSDKSNAIRAIEVIANQVQAHLDWALKTSRYH